ncbi:carbohydrate ABC transporter permease [Neobacillus cucumis]|uniref:Sugar ABC transporter ATP-binding protein n=1 Tax=Neobacillus cucumis TaxID=1740721 RepID=A0A2N5H6I9_9BACI|nr:carbohydrate ABC transporter permease [Neobacillus cucumis]PLS01133.1 sugar ABC transporter ATP-binding protein [Neobacillus cucumis]
MRKTRLLGKTLVYLILILGSCVMIFPFLWLVRSSLMSNNQIFTFPPEWIPKPFMWSNFSEALSMVPFAKYFMNTMTIELLVVPGVLLSSSLAAYSFAKLRWPGRNIWFVVLLSTLMLPYAVTLIPTFMFWRSLNALNTIIPLTVPAWFGGGAFNIFLMRQFFLSIPRELEEAAYMDGAKPFTVFWRIILPLSKPVLIVVGIFTFINVWNDFLGPLIYLSDDSKFTLAIGLASFKGMLTAQWGYLMAASAAVVAPIIVLFFICQRYFIEGITLTGLKG